MEDNTKYVIQNMDKHRNDKYDDNYLAKSYVMYTNLSNAAIFNSVEEAIDIGRQYISSKNWLVCEVNIDTHIIYKIVYDNNTRRVVNKIVI